MRKNRGVRLEESECFGITWPVNIMLFPGVIFALIPAALVGWLVTLIR